MTRLGAIACLAVLAATVAGTAGCGDPPSRVQLDVVGTRGDAALEIEHGSVELGSEVLVYSALLRIERAVLETSDDSVASPAPVNVDLFRSTILLEEEVAGRTLSSIRLELPPPSGDGVVPGEAISVYVAGVLDEHPFEYRDAGMEPLIASGPIDLDDTARPSVRFDLGRWFHDLDDDDLHETGGRYLIDATHNSRAASRIEAAIRASVSVGNGAPCSDCDDS
jgi:hypothetical protein